MARSIRATTGADVNGAEVICNVLRELGAGVVFGLPGTQNAALYDALGHAGLRCVVASDEGAAAFMASGYARARGDVAVLTTIPGPGFVYALAGVIEARQDSVPLLWLTQRQPDDGQAFPLQRIDQPALAREAVKRSGFLSDPGGLAEGLRAAWASAREGEPGPVLVEIAAPLLLQPAETSAPRQERRELPDLAPVLARLQSARRPLIYAGQGAQSAASDVRALARRWRAPVLFTSSGRGVLADDDPLAFVRDFSFGIGDVVPTMIAHADLVLALGCKFTHNGSAAGRLQLPREKLVRVDTSAEVLSANYPASVSVCTRTEDLLAHAEALGASAWTDEALEQWRARLRAESAAPIEHEPVIAAPEGASLRSVFLALRRALGDNVIYTTDAGLHQAVARRYAVVTQPRGLLCPSDFQSMGFGLPAAIGTALARPEATVVACVGDGALMLTLGDLLTAVREGVNLIVVVFNDGSYGLIRRQQLVNFGHSSGTTLLNPDYEALAAAVGCAYFDLAAGVDECVAAAAKATGVRLLEIRLQDSGSLARTALASRAREASRRLLPDSFWKLLRRALRR